MYDADDSPGPEYDSIDSDEELHNLKSKMKSRNEKNGFKHI